jgi:hypothetical protein
MSLSLSLSLALWINRKGKLLVIVGLSHHLCRYLHALGLPAEVPFYDSINEAVDLVNLVVATSDHAF